MTANILRMLTFAALLFGFTPLAAQTGDGDRQKYDVRQFTCPIGGKQFSQEVGYSAFPLITLPDGSWLGDTEIGVQIPVCPDNGLVIIPDLTLMAASEGDQLLYTGYSSEERSKLTALIADPTYQTLKNDGPYAQAWWIADQLKRPAQDRFFMLQRSTWATTDPAKRKHLVARFAKEGPAIIDAMDGSDEDKHFLRMYIVNALRELGQFNEALILMNNLRHNGQPIEQQSTPDSLIDTKEETDPMRLAIAQKDDGRLPAELLPSRLLNEVCDNKLEIFYGPTSPSTMAACKIRRDREKRASDDMENAFALVKDTVSLDRQCAATPVANQSTALIQACVIRQNEMDRNAARSMVKDGPKLVADCESTPKHKQNGPLGHACISYERALGMALGDQLAHDAIAFAIICPEKADEEGPADRADFASDACHFAIAEHQSQAEIALLAEPAALAQKCALKEQGAGAKDGSYEVLLSACSTLARQQEAAVLQHWADDTSTFDKNCGRFGRTNSSGNDVHDLTEAQEQCRLAWRLRANIQVIKEGEAKGLFCLERASYSPERPQCVSKEEYDRQMTPDPDSMIGPIDMSWLDKDSSLMKAAQIHAASIITHVKTEGSYPKEDE